MKADNAPCVAQHLWQEPASSLQPHLAMNVRIMTEIMYHTASNDGQLPIGVGTLGILQTAFAQLND